MSKRFFFALTREVSRLRVFQACAKGIFPLPRSTTRATHSAACSAADAKRPRRRSENLIFLAGRNAKQPGPCFRQKKWNFPLPPGARPRRSVVVSTSGKVNLLPRLMVQEFGYGSSGSSYLATFRAHSQLYTYHKPVFPSSFIGGPRFFCSKVVRPLLPVYYSLPPRFK